jgi:hypothetical protein
MVIGHVVSFVRLPAGFQNLLLAGDVKNFLKYETFR